MKNDTLTFNPFIKTYYDKTHCQNSTDKPQGRGFRLFPQSTMFLFIDDLRLNERVGFLPYYFNFPVTPSVAVLDTPSVVMNGVALHPYAHAVTDKHAVGMEDVFAQSVVYLHDAHVLRYLPFRGAGT